MDVSNNTAGLTSTGAYNRLSEANYSTSASSKSTVTAINPDKQLQPAHEHPAAGHSRAGDSLVFRTISQAAGSITQGVTRTLKRTSRVLGVAASCGAAVAKKVCLRSPEAIAQFYHENGGLCGKIGQYLAATQVPAEYFKSDQKLYNYVTDIVKSASQYSAGKVDPEVIRKVVERNVANAGLRSDRLLSEGAMQERSGTADNDSGSQFMANIALSAATVRHVETLGRGTICQVDQFNIDGQDFAVKYLSPELAEKINIDVSIMTDVFSDFYDRGFMSEKDFDDFSKAFKSFSNECDLSQELKFTEKASEALKNLTETNEYRVSTGSGHQVPVQFRVPEVAVSLSSPDALVMEYIDGCSLDRTDALRERLASWQPDWKEGGRLSETEIKTIIVGIHKLVLTVYLDSISESHFFNTDFQPGNFMMKLESDRISIYCIDHANSTANNDILRIVKDTVYYSLVIGLFLLFHSRATGNGLVEEQNTPSPTDTTGEVDVRDLVYTPISPEMLESLEEFIEPFRSGFGRGIIPPIDELQQFQREATVGAVCSQTYHWLKGISDDSNTKGPVQSEAAFVELLSRFLIRLAMEHEEQDMQKAGKATLNKVVGVPFDKLAKSFGFQIRPIDPRLMRVGWQLSAYRQYIGYLEALLDKLEPDRE